MKARTKLVLFILLFTLLFTGCSGNNELLKNNNKTASIGVVVGTFNDTWRTAVRNQLYELSEENNVDMSIWDAGSSQKTEEQKVDDLISRNVDVLVINLVDSTSADNIINKAKKANVPVIFFNIEPSSSALHLWDKVYYVGAIAEKSGTLQGQILADYFKNHPVNDGFIDYIMLKGPDEHQDAILRTKYSVQALEDAGFQLKELGSETADWDREQAKEKMEDFISKYGDQIDCVIANNDDMALGAIDSLKSNGYFKNNNYIPVVGVDATSSAVKSTQEGILLGTVLNDAVNQAKAVYHLANVLAKGEEPGNKNYDFPITDGKYIWIDYQMITEKNAN